MKLLYATTNPGKFTEVSKLFLGQGIKVHAPHEFNAALDIEETGTTLEENAILKAEAYLDLVPRGTIIISDDTGLEIDALGGEPGIKVRRWKGYKMTDDEILDYTLSRLNGVPYERRSARFHTVIAVAKSGLPTRSFSGFLPGYILEKPDPYREEGLPFQPLFYASDYGLLLYKIHALPTAKKLAKGILTHRERAVLASLPYLKSLIGGN